MLPIFIGILLSLFNLAYSYDSDLFTNEPDVLKPVYHYPNEYEAEPYKYWKENKAIPHFHGDKPSEGRLHQHYPKYDEVEQYKNFITDPPGIGLNYNENSHGSHGEGNSNRLDQLEIGGGSRTGQAGRGRIGSVGTNGNPVQSDHNLLNRGYGDDYGEKDSFSPSHKSDSNRRGQNIQGQHRSQIHEHSVADNKKDKSKSLVDKNNDLDNLSGSDKNLMSSNNLNDPLAAQAIGSKSEEPNSNAQESGNNGVNSNRQSVDSAVNSYQSELINSGYTHKRKCCSCCNGAAGPPGTQPNPPYGNNNGYQPNPPAPISYSGYPGTGCGSNAPNSYGFSGCSGQGCCQPQSPPCCIRLPTCCLPQLPCCPKIQISIQCCPVQPLCCQPSRPCGVCRSAVHRAFRTKRSGCIPCLGRKRRDVEAESREKIHIRQKRLGCIPCLKKRVKRQDAASCQKCSPFGSYIVSRVKRQTNCIQCSLSSPVPNFLNSIIAPRHRIMKRDIAEQNCDKSCCDYSQCSNETKPIYNLPKISGTIIRKVKNPVSSIIDSEKNYFYLLNSVRRT